ncbi:MAG: hypothetical protein F6J93_28130 [Oscillatoria sp. SIO1A7]|nr:hypothetical protein [Oscillatoria sp. SIO1A7]
MGVEGSELIYIERIIPVPLLGGVGGGFRIYPASRDDRDRLTNTIAIVPSACPRSL